MTQPFSAAPCSSSTSRSSSPLLPEQLCAPASGPIAAPTDTPVAKKKKKKKSKKASNKQKDAPSVSDADGDDQSHPPVLCISRNKHWRYISSYHGPWLQLPLELLESLLVVNMHPTAQQRTADVSLPQSSQPLSGFTGSQKPRDRGFASLGDHTPPESPPIFNMSTTPPPRRIPDVPIPPPIDPGVFRSVTTIRRLIDEASELAVRASSGLSAAALGSMRAGPNANSSPWALAQSLGLTPLKDGNGRNTAMSANRIHRLRALAVQKLAMAYRTDEIASSVMVMQGGSVFDDIAERVLRVDPHDTDAQYVHFFHEKIPSRQLAESTSPALLDALITAHPQHLELFRTRGIIHTFRDEYALAVRDFTHALKEARSLRKARAAHHSNTAGATSGKASKKKKGASKKRTNGQAPPDGTSAPADGGGDPPDGILHPLLLGGAPEPIEGQALFLRGAAYLQHAVFLIESTLLQLEGIEKTLTPDGAELRLSAPLPGARYGGVETGHPDGPLGARDSAKTRAYCDMLTRGDLCTQVLNLARKAVRDNERFLTHFGALNPPGMDSPAPIDIPVCAAHAFALASALRPGVRTTPPSPPSCLPPPPVSPPYHPLLVEAYFALLLSRLLLGDFASALTDLIRASRVVSVLEGTPIFLPPRSMAQAEFVEIFERLAISWRTGTQPHSLVIIGNGKQLALDEGIYTPSTLSSAPATPTFDPVGPSTSTISFMPSSSGSGRVSPTQEQEEAQDNEASDVEERKRQLDAARVLIAAVVEKLSAPPSPMPPPLSIPLHGPRVEIILAWLGGVWLPNLDEVA